MHEASITQSIIEMVSNTLLEQKIQGTVTKIHITTGVCQGLIPESMQMFFDMNKMGTLLEPASLIVTIQGMVALCAHCKTEHELSVPVMYCPLCGEPMKLMKGNEVIISSIEIEE
jgi:hydrogenase nickel incorporation protein HypA/HybF